MCECKIGKNNLILFQDVCRDCDKFDNKSDENRIVKTLEHLKFKLCRIFIHPFTIQTGSWWIKNLTKFGTLIFFKNLTKLAKIYNISFFCRTQWGDVEPCTSSPPHRFPQFQFPYRLVCTFLFSFFKCPTLLFVYFSFHTD